MNVSPAKSGFRARKRKPLLHYNAINEEIPYEPLIWILCNENQLPRGENMAIL